MRFGERTRSGTKITEWTKRAAAAATVQYGTATGGTAISPDPVIDGITYRILKFTSTGTLTVTSSGFFDVLLVGGGGSGGSWSCSVIGGSLGGGGGGAVVQDTIELTANQTITIGAGSGTTSVSGGATDVRTTTSSVPSLFALGGGTRRVVDCGYSGNGEGGCGYGGDGTDFVAGDFPGGKGYQGFNGGTGKQGRSGGGGGAGAIGGDAVAGGASGNGGAGKDISAFLGQAGGTTFHGGGGGGGGSTSGGTGGSGGGGAGVTTNGGGTAGGTNTGGGGGGCRATSSGTWSAAAGGSGVAYVRFRV